MFKYETHCHCNVTSACSKISPIELVDLYVKNGYTGIFVTDHFLNGNCHPYIKNKAIPYSDRIHLYCESYKQVKEAGQGKLDVFFGFEYSYFGTDILVYGLDEEALIQMEEIFTLSPKEFIKKANEMGALTVQAHPFREDPWIDHIRLFPDTMGVEIFNACQKDTVNAMGEYYCKTKLKIPCAGSDLHSAAQKTICGLMFEEKITSAQDYIEKVKAGLGILFKQDNILLKS